MSQKKNFRVVGVSLVLALGLGAALPQLVRSYQPQQPPKKGPPPRQLGEDAPIILSGGSLSILMYPGFEFRQAGGELHLAHRGGSEATDRYVSAISFARNGSDADQPVDQEETVKVTARYCGTTCTAEDDITITCAPSRPIALTDAKNGRFVKEPKKPMAHVIQHPKRNWKLRQLTVTVAGREVFQSTAPDAWVVLHTRRL